MAPPDAKPKEKFVGRSVPRLEDRPLLTGRGRFAADISFARQLHMRVVRSNFAHGRIRSIDPSAALAKAGRARGVDRRRRCRHSADRLPPDPDRRAGALPAAAVRDRHECATSASRSRRCLPTDPYLAEDARRACRARHRGTAAGPAMLTRSPASSNPAARPSPPIVRKGYGDVDAAFRSADAVIDERRSRSAAFRRPDRDPRRYCALRCGPRHARTSWRRQGAALEPRLRLRACSGARVASVHLYEGHVGGGFGVRGELYPEDVLVCAAAMRLRRPVKWIEDRREHLIAANHSRQQVTTFAPPIDSDGRILAIEDEVFHDQGAYMRTHAATVPDLTAAMLSGPVPRSGLSRQRAYSADQQDAVRNLSRARPFREHLCARAAARCDRCAVRLGSDRSSPAQPDREAGNALCASDSIRSAPRSSTIPATMQVCSTRRWRRSNGRELQEKLA